MNVLITICGRAGSKGVGNKNFREFLGKPMISYTIKAAKLFKEKNKNMEIDICLNSDNDIARKIALEENLFFVERPNELASDTASKVDAIRDVLLKMEKNENKKRTIEALKKNSKELLQTGTKDAAKIAAYSAIGIILKDLVQGIMIELRLTFEKRGNETLREIFNRFKDRVSKILVEIKSKWKDILAGSLEAGITAFLSNIVVFAINLFATTLKRFVAIIRAGFVSLVQAIKILANPPADMPKDEINYQALKVLTAGLIGALSLGLTEGIEKLLLSVPVLTPIMSLPLPFGDQTIGDAIAVTLSAMCGGLLTTVALYFMDKAQRETKESKIQIQLMAKSGEIVHMKAAQTWVVLGEAYDEFFNDAKQSYAKFEQAKLEINQSTKQASESVENFSKIIFL